MSRARPPGCLRRGHPASPQLVRAGHASRSEARCTAACRACCVAFSFLCSSAGSETPPPHRRGRPGVRPTGEKKPGGELGETGSLLGAAVVIDLEQHFHPLQALADGEAPLLTGAAGGSPSTRLVCTLVSSPHRRSRGASRRSRRPPLRLSARAAAPPGVWLPGPAGPPVRPGPLASR